MVETSQLQSTIVKVAAPVAIIVAAFLFAWWRGLSRRDDLGLRAPPAREAVLWIALWVAWMLGSNAVMEWRGPWDFTPWAATPLVIAVMRVAAVGVLGPIAEELLFRGYFFARVQRTRVGTVGAVVLLAAVWAAIHTSYSWDVIALLFINGILLGVARHRTKSVIVPMIMHVVWNLFAVW
jgi:membrane protease YdiL (CAAX protease family)